MRACPAAAVNHNQAENRLSWVPKVRNFGWRDSTTSPTVPPSVMADVFESLVAAIKLAMAKADPAAAELVAAECVVLAETKDHQNWELIGRVAEQGGPHAKALKAAHEAVEQDEDHHLYHTKGWCRELWIQSLGMPAVLPPPEEEKNVETAIGAARAENARGDYL